MSLSVIVPIFNEARNIYFEENLNLLSGIDSIEIILADGGSTDGTLDIINKFKFKTALNAGHTRADRLNTGIKLSSFDMVLLVHPRNLISKASIKDLQSLSSKALWGGFTHSFDNKGLFYKWTSWYSNKVRAKLGGIFYLDHCIFFHKSFINNDPSPVPTIPIFEDTAFSQKLKKIQRPILLNHKTITSAIRFEKNGPIKQSFKNFILKIFYVFNFSGHKANAFYEKKMNLNNIYDK